MSNLDDIEHYLAEINGQELEPVDLVRTAAERGWGPIGSILLLKRHLGINLPEAKGLTEGLCAEHGFKDLIPK